MEKKALTQAQQAHLRLLAERVAFAQQALQDYIGYLRVEHEAPTGEWELTEDGFVMNSAYQDAQGAEDETDT